MPSPNTPSPEQLQASRQRASDCLTLKMTRVVLEGCRLTQLDDITQNAEVSAEPVERCTAISSRTGAKPCLLSVGIRDGYLVLPDRNDEVVCYNLKQQ